jgi:putative component of membrane protein insertase Oxa1/YidC/SpoIIIJ protein YidD
VSALRERVRRQQIARALLMVAAIIFADAMLPPAWQPSNYVAIGLINVYQVVGRPISKRLVVCRYRPSCSDYGERAFAKYGTWRGLGKTVNRLWRCRASVPYGTLDEP